MNSLFEIIKRNKIWIILAVLITAVHVIYASLTQRGAYLDGALWILVLLNKFSSGNYIVVTDPGHTRFFINFLNQLPMAIGYFILSIKSKYWLSVLFSLPLFLYPPLLIWWNYKLSQRTERYDLFVLSVFIYGAMLLPFSIFSVVEIILAALLQIILLNYLVSNINYTKKDIALITILTISLFSSYGYVLFLGIILFLGSLYYASKEDNPLNKKVKYFIGLGGLLASLYTVVFIIVHTTTKSEAMRFMQEAMNFWPHVFHLNLILSITALALTALVSFKKNYLGKVLPTLAATIFLFILGYMFTHLSLSLVPMWEGHFRTIPCWAMPLIFTIVIILDAIKKKPSEVLCANILTIALICTISQTIWQINNSYWFNKNIEYMKNELKVCKSFLYVPEEHNSEMGSFFNKDSRRYLWNFAYTASSILFAPNKEIKTLLIQPQENTDGGGNLSYRDYLCVNDEKHFIIPTAIISRENSFWDATKVTKALNEYNKSHGLNAIDVLEP